MSKVKVLSRHFILILVLLLSFSTGYLFRQYRYSWRGYKDGGKYRSRYLGATDDGRKIHLSSFVTKDDPKCKNLVFGINNAPIYWEKDRNSDGRVDDIMHFENGVLIYESEDTNFDGNLNRKIVESYNKDGTHRRTMVDLNADNDFDLRIDNPDSDNPVVEIFVGNKWIKRIEKNGVYGIYDAEGNFLPVKFKDGRWTILAEK